MIISVWSSSDAFVNLLTAPGVGILRADSYKFYCPLSYTTGWLESARKVRLLESYDASASRRYYLLHLM